MAKNGTSPPIPAVDADWDEFWKEVRNVSLVFGVLLFVPVILLLAAGYGLRAGVKVFLEKSLKMFNYWGDRP